MRIFTTIIAASLLFLMSCEDDDNPTDNNQPQTFTSEDVNVGNGTANSWVTVDADGNPTEFGVWINENALEGLPSIEDLPENVPGKGYHLELPTNDFTDITGIHSIHLDWNPEGHEPPGIFDVPHFDLHFYVISDDIRNQIAPSDTIEHIDPKYIPEGYAIPDTTVIPGMGVHAGTLVAPGSFTRTYIYGYYSGEMSFFEPMFTVEYLNSHPTSQSFTIAVPEAFTYNGYAPQKITYHYDADKGGWNITLSDLMKVTAE